MRQVLFLLLFSLALFCGSSCNKDGQAPDLGYRYFPDKPGRFVVYDVDSFYYDDFNARIDTTKFQLKEKIESVYEDNEGRPTLRLERYVKFMNPDTPYAMQSWTLRDVWSANRTERTAEKVEENVRYIKLAFPVTKSQMWDGHAQNPLGSRSYSYDFFDQARIIGGMRFDSVLQVSQINELNLIRKQYYIERYAKNVGMVYREVIDVNSQPPAAWANEPDSLALFYSQDIMTRVKNGLYYKMTVNSYGIE
jgi:hypothetical protein